MKKLLKFELYKLKKTKSLYICSAIILALLLFSLLIRLILTKTWGEELMEKPSAVGSMLSSINSSDFILVVGIFIALYVCSDFSQHTIKNIFSRSIRGSWTPPGRWDINMWSITAAAKWTA